MVIEFPTALMWKYCLVQRKSQGRRFHFREKLWLIIQNSFILIDYLGHWISSFLYWHFKIDPLGKTPYSCKNFLNFQGQVSVAGQESASVRMLPNGAAATHLAFGRQRNEKQLIFVYLKLWAVSLTKRPNTFGLFYSKHTHWTIWLVSSWLCICRAYVNTYGCIKLTYVHLKGHCQVILWLFFFCSLGSIVYKISLEA